MVTILAIIGGVWVVGRLSRRSRHHPVHCIPELLRSRPLPQQVDPINGPSTETAQLQGSLIAGDGGGE